MDQYSLDFILFFHICQGIASNMTYSLTIFKKNKDKLSIFQFVIYYFTDLMFVKYK